MRASISAAGIAASVLLSGTAWSACPPGKTRNCVNLDLVPQISQQVGSVEHFEAPPVTAPTAEARPAYTGPTVGLAPTVARTPTVGYRWSID